MAIEKENSKSLFFEKRETLEREEREKILFRDFSSKLRNITNLSKGWSNILKNIDLKNINSRADLSSIPITKKSSLPSIQKKNASKSKSPKRLRII